MTPRQPEPVPARQRAPTRPEGRDWPAEAKWVAAIVDQKLAAFGEQLTDAIGQVVAQERKATKAAIEAVRGEMKAAIADALGEVRTAIGGGNSDIAGMLDRCIKTFEVLMAKLEQNGAVLDSLAQTAAGARPH